MAKTILHWTVKETRRRERGGKTPSRTGQDWTLANLSEHLKIENGGDRLLRRHMWGHDDHQC